MEKLSLDVDNKLNIMRLYGLSAEQWFFVELLFLYHEGHTDHLAIYLAECVKSTLPRDTLKALKDKDILHKDYQPPGENEDFDPDELAFSAQFTKTCLKNSFDLGEELYYAYPDYVQGGTMQLTARNVTQRGFQDENDFFIKYAKKIRYSVKKHNEILEILAWAREHELLQYGICEYVATSKWVDHQIMRDKGEIGAQSVRVSTLEDV